MRWKCQECEMLASVIETRHEKGYTRRRYECPNGHRLTTKESIFQKDAISKEDKVKRLKDALQNAAKLHPHQLWRGPFNS